MSHIQTRSPRSLRAACQKLGVAMPESHDALGDLFLQLLVEGHDHRYVGSPVWFSAILDGAAYEERRDGDPIRRFASPTD